MRRINSAPRLAIMIVGALVLVEVAVGMTEASMTRSRSTVHPQINVPSRLKAAARQLSLPNRAAGSGAAGR